VNSERVVMCLGLPDVSRVLLLLASLAPPIVTEQLTRARTAVEQCKVPG